jgi:hypothetical protein
MLEVSGDPSNEAEKKLGFKIFIKRNFHLINK